jgi:hypothetical protein
VPLASWEKKKKQKETNVMTNGKKQMDKIVRIFFKKEHATRILFA